MPLFFSYLCGGECLAPVYDTANGTYKGRKPHVDMDFDHQFIPAHKYDAKYSNKKDFGYFPGWASIGGIIVGGENRDGNANVKFRQEDTLRRIMDRMKSELGVVIERFRADCGSFSKEIVRTVEERSNTFYIRASWLFQSLRGVSQP